MDHCEKWRQRWKLFERSQLVFGLLFVFRSLSAEGIPRNLQRDILHTSLKKNFNWNATWDDFEVSLSRFQGNASKYKFCFSIFSLKMLKWIKAMQKDR